MKRFESATLRLTLWYVLIITVLSLLFSSLVYVIAARELHRPFGQMRLERTLMQINTFDEFEEMRLERESEGKSRLISSLLLFNIVVITTGGAASYLLAKRTLQPIEETFESQIRFSSDAAHELRTPLTVMQSEIEIGLRDKKASIVSQRRILESNLDEIHRLQSLTDRLLILASEKDIPLGPVDADEVVTDAINHVLPLALDKKIQIDNLVGKEKVFANREMLADVLVILMDNAIKYSPSKTSVKISSERQGRHLLIYVTDTGPGISEKDLPYIFDRFYRAETSRNKAVAEGYGLGLSIAKRIIEAHHGKIIATSTLGKGTTFSIRLQIP